MDDSEAVQTRREYLRLLGISGGATALAGCNGLDTDGDSPSDGTTAQAGPDSPSQSATEPDDTTTSAEGTTPETTRTQTSTESSTARISVETEYEAGEESQRLSVAGQVEASGGIERVSVAIQGETEQIAVGGESEYDFETVFGVEGGRRYQITVTVTDSGGGEHTERVETDHVPIVVDPLDADRLVGAHYYPWYEMHSGHENWTDRTVSEPVLGEYAADDRRVIDQHVKWSLEHGIGWWSVSWWGPDSVENRVLDETLTEATPFQDLEFSILYETKGRFEEFDYDLDDPNARERLADDLTYLDETYFDQDNYRTVDGRPVVFFYIAAALSGDVESAFAAATTALESDPYVLADLPFGTTPNSYPVSAVTDAVTTYNPYSPREDIEEVFHDLYDQGNEVMHLAAEASEIDFVPVAMPGYDDTGLPTDVRVDNPVLSPSPARYERVCEQVAPHLEDAESVLVTSFNEWYEDTQIEPDEDDGMEYLTLTAENLATGASPGFDPAGVRLRFAFNETIVPAEVNPDSTDGRPLAFMAGGLSLLDGDRTVRSFDIGEASSEPLFLKGVYGSSSDETESWRWFGGQSAETVLFVEGDVAAADTALLRGEPMRTDEIEADVYVDGTKTDHVAFGARDGEFDEYELSLATTDE